MVEVKEGFVVKDGNTKTNSIAIQTNKIGHQEIEDCKKDKMTKYDRKNRLPSGGDASVNNDVFEVARATRVYNVTSNEMGHQEVEEHKKDKMTKDDRKNGIPSGDDTSLNSGVYDATRVTGVYKIASNKM